MHLRYRIVLVAAFSLLIPLSMAVASPPWINLTLDPDGWQCDVYGDFVPVYVILRDAVDVSGVSFAAETDPNSGFVYAGAASTHTVTGDAQAGFDIQFGSCLSGDIHVMTLFIARTSPDGEACSTFHLTPHPSYGEVRYLDCQGASHRADRGVGIWLNPTGFCTYSSIPYRPFPADGATEVPLETNLEWTFDMPDCGGLCGRGDYVYFGTAPDPPLIEIGLGSPFPVGPLQPETTYYWRIVGRRFCLDGAGPVWRFTTAKGVATQQSTWGAIKALYR